MPTPRTGNREQSQFLKPGLLAAVSMLATAAVLPWLPARAAAADKGQEALSLKGHTDAVYSVPWSPDGKHLAAAAEEKTVMLWDVGKGK